MSMNKFSTFTNVDYPLTPKVPEHWRALPCRAFVAEKVEKNNDGIEREYLSLMSNVGVIRYSEKGDVGNKAPDDLTKCKVVEKGNLVINSMNYSIGSYGISPYNGVCSPVYIVLEPITSVVSRRFALRIFENKEFQNWAQSFGSGILAHRAAIGWDDLKNIIVGIPPLGEQQKIAQFLDYETSKIDALIDEQKRLIELLKEKRQAVISHAVTKGLNPDAPMKDSGVEWLGEVPEHWEVSKIKWKLKTTSGGTPSTSRYEEYYEGEIPWIRTTDLNNSLLFETEIYVTQKAVTDTSCRVVPINSVLIAMYGGDGTIGKHSLLMFDAAINQAVCALLPSNELRPKFLHDYIEFYRPFWMIGAESSRKDPNIGQDRIGDHFCLVPPISEQVEIEKRISDLKGKYDSLQRESVRNIRILQERRSALISAAVTGKIDVRDWQPPAGSDTVDSNASVQTERHYG